MQMSGLSRTQDIFFRFAPEDLYNEVILLSFNEKNRREVVTATSPANRENGVTEVSKPSSYHHMTNGI